ncbi:MAG TPA: UDP-glucose/GDP-mannose dehydrogenase family protein [Verrucomicrobiae bacterium]|nr:UDP-glucose/GDP-mannose dehydrogenase family protein [Verrucomicrobiae bacterium]
MKISVFGLGYVGSVTAVCFADRGHDVVGVETNPDKLALFRSGQTPLFEPGLAELLTNVHGAGRFTATADAAEAIHNSSVSFICVGTPSKKGGQADLSHIEHVSREIGEALREKHAEHTIVVRSTMLPGSIEGVVIPQVESASGKRAGRDFHVVANPEFMREGSAIPDFYEPPFVVIGERNRGEGDSLAHLYGCINAPQVRISIRAAEALKFACNAFHAMKITFANEIGQFCKAHDIDSHEVMDIVCRDTKLNVSKSYLRPGLAYGGSCLPKDLRALVGRARERDVELPMLDAISRSNLNQIQRTIEFVTELGHREVGILGLSFKVGTDDLRESPIVIMAETLLGKGFKLTIHDSEVELTRLTGANKRFLEDKLPHINSLLATSLPDVLGRSKTLVVCKNAPEYGRLAEALAPHHHVVDLVGAAKYANIPAARYHGLYW